MSIKKGDQTIQRKEVLVEEKDSITEAIIHQGVNKMKDYEFLDCSSLNSVTIPNSVTTIRFHAFQKCSNLTSITIPNNLTKIEELAFAQCTSLKSITIPNSVTKIGVGAFFCCTNLTSITIPNGITSIELNAFKGCSSLKHLIIPDSLNNQDPSHWAQKGIDLDKTKLITHSQLSEWAKEYNLEGHYSLDELYTLYQLQKDDHYQPSWPELGKRSRHILVGDLLTILPEDKKNAILPQTLISQHDSKEGQLLHTLSLLSQAPIENLNQENENNEYNTLSLGESLGNTLTLADTAKLLLLSVEKPKKAKNTTSSSTDEVSIPPLARRPLDSIKHSTQNPRRR